METLKNIISITQSLRSFFELATEEASGDTYHPIVKKAIHKTMTCNSWFDNSSVDKAFDAWNNALHPNNVKTWLNSCEIKGQNPKNVAIIMAGNIPLVGLHDLICVIVSGHRAVIKCSSKDRYLMPCITDYLVERHPELRKSIRYADGELSDYDAVIATGSDNSARYFEYYFKNIPKIIRKSRTSVAVFDGSEDKNILSSFGKDVFTHFGLGCRNVSKIFIPKNYDLSKLIKALDNYKNVVLHNKYANNYTYYKAILLMNREDFLDNGFLILKESEKLKSPTGVLFYEFYDSLDTCIKSLEEKRQNIQCVVSDILDGGTQVGESQNPNLWDYADRVNTIDFLSGL